MQGNLHDMTVADLIQHTCQDRRTARLTVSNQGRDAVLFFRDGAVVHASLGQLDGEDVVYQVLDWEDGHFDLEFGVQPPAFTIKRSWSGLLLEGARLLDERADSEVLLRKEEEANRVEAKNRTGRLAEVLEELLASSSDLEGAAVVGTDGLVYAASVQHQAMDEAVIGAASAAVYGLSKRSADQLKRGALAQTCIQGDDGHIIVASLDPETIFVGLTPKNVNLGMAFAEVRGMLARLRGIT